MGDYRVRQATTRDVDALVRQRTAMFSDMGVPMDVPAVERAFREWLLSMMPSGTYRAWLVETDGGEVVGGGGATILPWPPGASWAGGRLAFVYNVFTEQPHRRRGLGRRVMEAIHAWCRAEGITSIALNASPDGLPLYESLGYRQSPAPMMFLPLTTAKR